MKIAFLTLGCKVNHCETEKMKSLLEQAGHQIVPFAGQADVYVVNTCTVTNIADQKSRKMLHRARRDHPSAVVAAVGCYAEFADRSGALAESVDLFVTNQEKDDIVPLLEQFLAAKEAEGDVSTESGPRHPEGPQAVDREQHTRAYVKIQSGCNQYCTYCIIPYARGALVSRDDEEILREAQTKARKGFQEIVVTGIHLSSFGVDRQGGKIDAGSFLELEGRPLLELLERLSQIEGIGRIRLGSLEPRIITEEFARELSENIKVCPHFHLSLQSGSDAVLARMNRHYTAEGYLRKVEILRRYWKDPAVTTDIIVGFPQETEEEFEETCRFARKASFARIHVFPYSRRQGTTAASMEGQVDGRTKKVRSARLMEIGRELSWHYQQSFLGRGERILTEEVAVIGERPYLVGYNERYVRIAVAAPEEAYQWCNRFLDVTVAGHLTEEILLAERLLFTAQQSWP